MQYFIHGDDFGRNPAKTEAIDALICGGKIQTTTLLVNLNDTEHAVELAKKHGYQERVCLHLNLSEGKPLTEAVKKTGLCNASGVYRWAHSKRILATCMFPGAIHAIRKEAEAQMKVFREMGFSSRRMDSHDWILFNYPVWLAVKPLLKRYGFETTRRGCERWIRTQKLPLRKYYRFMEKRISKSLKMEETWSGGLKSFRDALNRGLITAETRAEIMTHPELIDGELIDVSLRERVPMREVEDTLTDYAGPATWTGEK